MHVLITGGAGFIGSHLVEFHLAKGDIVHAIDNLSTGSINNILSFQDRSDFRFENIDIENWLGLDHAVAWADRIYHLAAIVGVYRVLAEPLKVLTTNIMATQRLLEAVARNSWKNRVLLASSSEVYGHASRTALSEEDNLILESAAHSRWNYAISKLADEALGLAYFRSNQLPITMLRIFNTVGTRQVGRYGMVLPRLVQQACHNEPITVFGDGTQTRCFCDVRDTVTAFDLVANTPNSVGEIVNIGSDQEISINELAALVCKLAKSKSIIEHIPYDQAYGEAYNDIQQRKPDLTKLQQLTGFKPIWTLEQTIQELILKI